MQAFVPSDDKPDADSAELTGVTFDFDAKPLIVLSRDVDEGGPGVPIAALPRVEAAWRAGHAALATRSTKGKHIVVLGARHYVQIRPPLRRHQRGQARGDGREGGVRSVGSVLASD